MDNGDIIDAILHIRQRRKKRKRTQIALIDFLSNELVTAIPLVDDEETVSRKLRSCRRLERNFGWWDNVNLTYDEERFKKMFRMSRDTFNYILNGIKPDITKEETVQNDTISPEFRLAICLYRLSRGDYLETIAELMGIGVSTVSTTTLAVSRAIVERFYDCCVNDLFPKTLEAFKESILDMEEFWQMTFAFAALDGCHLSIKKTPGGFMSAKEYHNFKNFYSIVLMALVDLKYRFIWTSVGYPGNSHDSTIFKSTSLYQAIMNGKIIPNMFSQEGEVEIRPIILGDSAFPFHSWLMKPYTNLNLTEEQRYFNYRLSRGRIVSECAFGRLKSRWRILYRKCEASKESMKLFCLTCIVLHNICESRRESIYTKENLSVDPASLENRPREIIRDMLDMVQSNRRWMENRSNAKATAIREQLTKRFWNEKNAGAY